MANLYGPRIVTNGLVLCLDAGNSKSYPGSGTLWRDLSGNNNNGTLINGPTYSSANKGSIVFDGTNDFINLTSSTSLRPSNVTASAWFKRSNINTSYKCIVESRKTFWVSYAIHITESGLIWYIGYLDSSPYAVSVTATNNYNDNKWHNVVGTYDRNNLKIYVDGVLQTSSAFSSAILYTGTLNFLIGFHFESTSYFDGSISNTMIYNRALSENEILQNYNATKGRFV